MTIAIRIGASSTAYDNLNSAYVAASAAKQKLSITGTGEEVKAELTNLYGNGSQGAIDNFNNVSKTIGSIKATNDLNLSTIQIRDYKAALVKLGTKSIVLDSGTTATNIQNQYNDLDAVYTKVKSITLAPNSTAPTIAVDKLATSINMGGLEALMGKKFNVTGTKATIESNMDSLLKNVSRINEIQITGANDVEFTIKQLAIVGDKLRKLGTGKVTLTDTADNILATSSIALINKLNNTNINAPSTTATITAVANSKVTAAGGHGFNTGDAVTFNGAGGAAGNGTSTVSGNVYYARRLSGTEFQIYNNYDDAVNTATTAGIVNPGGATASAGTFTSQVGNSPLRTTTLDNVKVLSATLNQAQRLGELTAVDATVTTPGAINRLMSNIIKSVEIADTVANLDSGLDTKLASGYTTHLSSAGEITTSTAHHYKTGDAVTYSVPTVGTAKINELTSGATYYVGKTGASSFALFNSRNAALTADYTSLATLATGNANGNAINFATSNTATNFSDQTFTTSSLDKTMSDVFRFKDNTGEVGRVTIKGSGAITSLELSDIATKALRGNASGQVTYSAKAIDIQNNMQSLYDNLHAQNMTGITEVVVNDGTAKGKKALTLSDAYFQVLKGVFAEGVDKHLNPIPVNAKNYSFNVTGATYARLGTLQGEMDVGAFAVVGATAQDLTVGGATQLASDLGKSKLKTLTSEGVTSVERATIQNLLNSVGSGPDRAKLKLVNKI